MLEHNTALWKKEEGRKPADTQGLRPKSLYLNKLREPRLLEREAQECRRAAAGGLPEVPDTFIQARRVIVPP